MLTQTQLRELLHYEPKTGVFTWKAGRRNGKPAGCVTKYGYLQIKIARRGYFAHRLAWLYMHGAWPAQMVDHRDTNKLNNAINNLRPADDSINQQNVRRSHRDSSTQLLGVYPYGDRWSARITVRGIRHYLGAFETAEAAHAAYVTKKREIHEGCTL